MKKMKIMRRKKKNFFFFSTLQASTFLFIAFGVFKVEEGAFVFRQVLLLFLENLLLFFSKLFRLAILFVFIFLFSQLCQLSLQLSKVFPWASQLL